MKNGISGPDPAITLTFLVKAKDIIRVLPKSLTIKASKGWESGSNPLILESKGVAAFSIQKKGSFLGKMDDTKVEGTIDIQTSTKLIPKTFSLLEFDQPLRIDDFVFTLLEGKLKVDGNHKLIKKISVEHNGKVLDQFGSSGSADSKNYGYKGIGKGAKITFSYWDEVVTKTVHFSNK